ncbi:MAG: rhodanese-like domain-containing protein [Pseudomonadota bacterium]
MNAAQGFFKTALFQAALIVLTSALIGLAVNHLRTDGLPLVEDWSVEARLSSPQGGSLMVTLEEARALHEAGKAVFIDARPEVWFEVGRIEGALNIPAEQVETLYSRVLAGLAKDVAIITYCDGETCELSHDLALALLEKGYTNVRVLVNGWTLWSEAALPVEGSGS